MNDNSLKVVEVDINDVLPNRFQPRIQFDEEEILELSDSIKEHGVIQPIVVRTVGDKYEIIAGERRYKASVLAGKETVPVIVKNLNDKDSAEIALIENVQRKNLTPIEEALSYKKILDMGYITQESLASKLGKSQSSVANKIRLLNLSDEVQDALLGNKISERHARSLLRLQTKEQQNQMLNRIISERLTVRRTDEEIDKLKNSSESQDESNSDTQKIIEKGEINMNNNMMPNMENNNTMAPNFDIFGNNPQPVQPQSTVDVTPTSSFDIFADSSSINNNQFTSNPVVSSFQQTVETPKEVPQFDLNQVNNSAEQSQNAMSQFVTNTTIPSIQPVNNPQTVEVPQFNPVSTSIEQPQIGGIQFDTNGIVKTEPTVESMNLSQPVEMPQVNSNQTIEPMNLFQQNSVPQFDFNTPVQPSIPETSPIIENPIPETQPINNEAQIDLSDNNLFSFGPSDPQQQEPIQSTKNSITPEPIIITDYNKQYDPIMPQNNTNPVPVAEFKEVINAIRECSSKIEKYGFKIDVEEYDLANLYQVIFKIEK